MLRQGFVVLSQQDSDALGPPAVATCSKDDAWDDGGYALGVRAAAAGMLWCDRPYFTGNPSVDWLVAKADRVTGGGGVCQLGNEQNLVLEGWSGGPTAWHLFQQEVRAAAEHPERCLAMPPSPGVPGWQDWVAPSGPFAVHAYGSFDQMRQVLEWYLGNRAGDLYVTECNFGAGNAVDVDAWARDHLRPFLDWCARQPRVTLAAHFAWVWRGAPPMPTPVDARGTAVERVIREWTPREEGTVADIVPTSLPTSVQLAAPANYQAGPRAATTGVVVHTTRGGAASPARELAATVSWFKNPASGVSAHLVVGHAGIVRCVHDADVAWHARTANRTHLGLELVQQTPVTPITDAQYTAAAEICRLWASAHAFPLVRRFTEREPGLVGHEDTESGKADGKTDPGVMFSWERFLALCRGAPAPAYDVDAARDRLWREAEALEHGGWPWFGQGIKSVVSLSKGER